METKANYIATGVFTLAVIVGAFGFIFWFQNAGRSAAQATYRVVFDGSVSGLRTGAAVLFNGIRVGEVAELALDAADPHKVVAVIALGRSVPTPKWACNSKASPGSPKCRSPAARSMRRRSASTPARRRRFMPTLARP